LRLAETLSRRSADLADQLFTELERADVFPDGEPGHDVVRMGSTVEYETDSGEVRTVALVFPGDENIVAGRISILTPIGAALIGLAKGDSIDWRTRDGRTQRLTVTRIAAPLSANFAARSQVSAAQ
jgi:regulator of nucleoside diphosphate kinase